MSIAKLRNLLVLGTAIGLSAAAFAGDGTKSGAPGGGGVDSPQQITSSTNGANTSAPVDKVQPQEKININTASANELRKVKGIGKKISQAIIDYRSKNGNFKSVNDLLSIKSRGIHKHWFDKVSGHLTV
jgi:competence ComEA-like helix-hairpin-helix protein